MKKWTIYEINFLINNYPNKGKKWCSVKLNRSTASIREKASILKLRLNYSGEFFKDFQRRAAKGKVGGKRSDEFKEKLRIINTGKKMSELSRLKMSISQKKRFMDKNERERSSKMMKKIIKENGHPKGMLKKKHNPKSIEQGKKTKLKRYGTLYLGTDKSIKKMLNTKMLRYGNYQNLTENTYSRCKKGWLTISGKRYFYKSKWEMNYANYLQFLKNRKEIIDWEYEEDIFWFYKIKRGVRSYKPDFKIFNKDKTIEYHEVKGWKNQKSMTKLSRMKKYYPEIKLVLIDEVQYKEIKKWSKLIPGWED